MTPQITIRIRSKRDDDFHVYHLNPNWPGESCATFFQELELNKYITTVIGQTRFQV